MPGEGHHLDTGRVGERVEVDDDERNRINFVAFEVGSMFDLVDVGEDRAVHFRMQCHDSMAEDRGESREVSDVGDRDART